MSTAAEPKYPHAGVTPWRGAVAITPSDTNELIEVVRGLRVDVAGTVTFICADGTGPFTINVAAGGEVMFWIRQVKATGTTATGLLGGR
jgi:hypothetical protein